MSGTQAPTPLAPVWLGLDLGGFHDWFETEHRVLTAVSDLRLPVDHVVVHERAGVVPGASAVLRVPGGREPAVAAANSLHRRLNGTVVVLAPASGPTAPIVLGHAGAAWDCLWAAAMTRDSLAGSCVRFPGQDRLTGFILAQRVLERSAITRLVARDRIVGPDDLVDARDDLRPVFTSGHLVLRVSLSASGTFVPDPVDDVRPSCLALG